jgi:predicted secreted Zn-dependent protease
MDGMNWRKASYSANGEACVEVAAADVVLIRDTTDRQGGTLAFTAEAWSTFMAGIKGQS